MRDEFRDRAKALPDVSQFLVEKTTSDKVRPELGDVWDFTVLPALDPRFQAPDEKNP